MPLRTLQRTWHDAWESKWRRMPQLERASDDDRLMSLVDAALAQPPGERETWLRRECGGDSHLFDQAREYLESEERMGGFLLEPFCTLELFDPALEPGELLEDRFRIIREVGEGGMAIVYEAMDETLGKRRAIKCAKAGFQARLTPEVRHATEIAHDNVCKIFDFHSAGTDRGEIGFINMEFLDGPTLAERLRPGPLPEREARAIARQLCAGLAAAHRCQVVHGDLKSNNVILTKAADRSPRAVITDFGLARGLQPPTESAPPGRWGSVVGGASDYMAPELRNGERPSVASDIYALGCICYEMLVGTRVRGEPLRVHPKWNGILSRCLAQDPDRRYRSVEEIKEALAPKKIPRWALVAAGVALAAISGVMAWNVATAPKETVKLAITPLEADGPMASIAAGLSKTAAAQVARIKSNSRTKFEVVPMKRATHILWGNLRQKDGKIVLRTHVADLGTQRNGKEWQFEYAPSDLRYAPVALTGVVTEALNLPALAVASVNAAAAKDYAQGVKDTRQNSTLEGALHALQRAVEEDRDSPLTHAALAEAQWFKYFLTKDQFWANQAKELLLMAESRDPDTAPAHRVEGYLYYKDGLYGKAQAEFKRAVQLQPDNATAHIWLGKAYEDNNQLEQARTEFQTATHVEPMYFRTYQNLGAYYQDRSDLVEAAKHYAIALRLAPKEAGLEALLAGPCMDLGWFRHAERHLRASLDQQETVSTEYRLGRVLMYERNDKDAVHFFRLALGLLDQGFPPGGTSRPLILMYLGIAYRRLNQVKQADEAIRSGMKFARVERDRNFLDGYVNAFLGYFDAALGNRDAAEEEVDRAASLFRDNADIRWRAVLTYEELHRRFHDPALRDAVFRVLQAATAQEIADLNRWPDLADLQRDSRFTYLVNSHPVEDGGNVCAQ
jgi:tetratricopeptide (TPR) repeat protein